MAVRLKNTRAGSDQEEGLVAVKVVDKSRLADARATCNRLRRGLLHPFVARNLWIEETENHIFAATELYSLPIEELAHLATNRDAFDEVSALFYAAELALGLGYLHSKEIVHGALKPSNILADRRGHVALSDFGIFSEHLSASMIEYVAPERLTNANCNQDAKASDWWSLGAVTYRLLSGAPPFRAITPRALFSNILHRSPSFDESFHVAFEESSAESFIGFRPVRGSPVTPTARCKAARAALGSLLAKKPAARLRQLEDLKLAPWFNTVAWDDILRKLIEPPRSAQLVFYVDQDAQDGRESDIHLSVGRGSKLSVASRSSSALPSLDEVASSISAPFATIQI